MPLVLVTGPHSILPPSVSAAEPAVGSVTYPASLPVSYPGHSSVSCTHTAKFRAGREQSGCFLDARGPLNPFISC